MKCDYCGKEIVRDGVGTGYAVVETGKKMCYACCGAYEARILRETKKLQGYLHGNEFTNWPGTFRIPLGIYRRVSRNNFGAKRTDFWATWEGRRYHGVQVGDNTECAWIKEVKA